MRMQIEFKTAIEDDYKRGRERETYKFEFICSG